MFDLRKIFDLREIFAVPKDFLKSKIYCTTITQHKSKCAQYIEILRFYVATVNDTAA
jgi:hypothetical protein